MLVLKRSREQVIRIGDDIVVKIIDTGRGHVKIGIDAPTSVRVLRGEVASALADPVEYTPSRKG